MKRYSLLRSFFPTREANQFTFVIRLFINSNVSKIEQILIFLFKLKIWIRFFSMWRILNYDFYFGFSSSNYARSFGPNTELGDVTF